MRCFKNCGRIQDAWIKKLKKNKSVCSISELMANPVVLQNKLSNRRKSWRAGRLLSTSLPTGNQQVDAIHVTQLERDTVLVCLDRKCLYTTQTVSTSITTSSKIPAALFQIRDRISFRLAHSLRRIHIYIQHNNNYISLPRKCEDR